MMERPAIIEIEKREGSYRVELREHETGRSLGSRTLGGIEASRMTYKHVCKVRLPIGDEPTIDVESGGCRAHIVLRTPDRTCYRHSLPTPLAAN